MSPLPQLLGWTEETLGISHAVAGKLAESFVAVLLLLVARRVARRVVVRAIADVANRYVVNNSIAYVLGFVAIVALVKIWTDGVSGLATYFGLASAGVAIALQDPLINLAGWAFILLRRPFTVGDRIQIGSHAGDVVDIRIFSTLLLEIGNWVHADQSTGRLLHVPNGWVFKNAIASYDHAFGYIWNELEIVLTFESNWKRAKEVLTQTVTDHAEHLTADAERGIEEAAEHFHIKFAKLTPVVWTSVADSGIRLTVRYLCRPRERRSSESEIWESVLEALGALPDVDFAYPTTRYFDNAAEGKARAGVKPGSA